MKDFKSIEQRCNFKTRQLSVKSWIHQNEDLTTEQYFTEKVLSILTPQVTKFLPDGWQKINNVEDAQVWIKERLEESCFLTVELIKTNELVGFIFLYKSGSQDNYYDLRFGYLLSETIWGKGLGTELVKGLAQWCEREGNIKSISGGVTINNVGSIKVLEKCGFSPTTLDNVVIYERKFNCK
ncbi:MULTISPECIES: GNAT family N-acetyltransferase [Psychrilyobacter]|uniref:GNAT family N-acetyltransferase n=1 Tax=Psychrilyobacter piezotolerans TaxID=2293438 RepID=A0ABX9KHC0_9FUSO|nr:MULTISPECIES: GNAT family N-acetyltransferase [Psychrilyobacter]MCS5420666.1 GNAT family N-acetyltransferase [Psychrilyobacter sp. S5]NDI77840.1 GNAT family N-acetyltransferase [Psychrilyobacter piezotolerans]RDE62306.1 N-acetyltransferase [Psychrilyobacter sp. S5]REI41404.1 GNAT family N-acetyltransferase [Psychrilyobacter piezotolerans]